LRPLQEGKVPNRAVVITFDDGHADNLHQAKPLLERYEIPATVAELRLHINGSVFEWELGEASTYTEEDYRRDRDWHVEQQDDPTPHQCLFRSLYQRLHALIQADRQQLLEELRTWAGVEPSSRPTHRTLSHDEVARLAKGGLVEIGAHGVTHAVLAALSVGLQREEIRCSRAHLEAMLNHPVT
jgi:peptidoglycan/xylan/chitin deacetylase (PgdA/CDA1 family)